jgi:hypothetical protein
LLENPKSVPNYFKELNKKKSGKTNLWARKSVLKAIFSSNDDSSIGSQKEK